MISFKVNAYRLWSYVCNVLSQGQLSEQNLLIFQTYPQKNASAIDISVQAEFFFFTAPTFLDPFDPRIHMPGHFPPWDVVFSYPKGPLAPSSWPPRLDPPILTVFGC